MKVGGLIGINETSTAGLIASMANNIPMCEMMNRMNARGKIINSAFMVSGTFVIGDDLAFAASVNKEMILPVIAGKAVGGLSALAVAWFATRKYEENRTPYDSRSSELNAVADN